MALFLLQNKSADGMETVLSELEESCTISILTDAGNNSINSSKRDDSRSHASEEQQSDVNAILNSMNQALSTSLQTRIAYHYELVFHLFNTEVIHLTQILRMS